MPTGQPGPEAEALAHRIERAVRTEAWAQTGAVRFRFVGHTEHLWDRQRSFDRVRFGDGSWVLLDVNTQRGRAYGKDGELDGEARDQLLRKAYASFCNDTFWLNPLAKLYDQGVTRSRVVDRDGESLLIHYASGGVTPGDTYQWLMGPDDLPRAWRLFVHVIPVPGLEISWEGWTDLPTGARIATRHGALGLHPVGIEGLAGAATLAELEPGADPFAALLQR
jgi:hypothetical protein